MNEYAYPMQGMGQPMNPGVQNPGMVPGYPGPMGQGMGQMPRQNPGNPQMYPGMGQPVNPAMQLAMSQAAQNDQTRLLPMQQGSYTPSTQKTTRIVPVASYDEAKAVPTDFLGNLIIMTDFAHGMVYTKVLDTNTGNPIFKIYAEMPEPEPTPPAPVYDAQNEIAQLRAELNALKKELGILDHRED